jgi:predicted kinase
LIGLPGSGKSTCARSLLAVHPSSSLISTDTIRAQLFGDAADQGAWLKVWLEVRQQMQAAVECQVPLTIYDATNVVRRQRRDAIALARSCGFTRIIAIWVDVPLEVCLARNQQRDRVVPTDVILRMQRRLEGAPPSLAEDLDGLVAWGNL